MLRIARLRAVCWGHCRIDRDGSPLITSGKTIHMQVTPTKSSGGIRWRGGHRRMEETSVIAWYLPGTAFPCARVTLIWVRAFPPPRGSKLLEDRKVAYL